MNRPQFSIAFLLVVTTAVGVGLGVCRWIVDSGVDVKTLVLVAAVIAGSVWTGIAKAQTL
jgi:hypothetical protein